MQRTKLLLSKNNKLIMFILVAVLVLTLLFAILMPFFQTNVAEVNAFTPMAEQTSEKVEMLNNLPQDFTVDITSDKDINVNNLSQFVKVTDSQGTGIDVGIEKQKDFYTILPPDTLYKKGQYYTIALTNAKFKEDNIAAQSSVMFATAKEDVKDISAKQELKSVPEQKVIFISESEKTIEMVKESGRTYNVGDILLLPDPEDGLGEAAFKIEEINADNGEVISLKFSRPSLDEVYDKVEIYGTQNPTEENVTFFSEEEIKEQILNSESVRSVGFAVAAMEEGIPASEISASKSKGASESLDFNLDLKLPFDIKFKIKKISFNPFEVTVSLSLKWDIKKIGAVVTFTSEFSAAIEPFTNINANENIYSTGTRTKISQTVQISIDFSKEVTDLFEEQKKNLEKKQMLKFFDACKIIKSPMCPEFNTKVAWWLQSLEAVNKGNDDFSNLLTNKTEDFKNIPETVDEFISSLSEKGKKNFANNTEEAKKYVLKELEKYMDCYKQGQQNLDSSIIPIAVVAIPFPNGCSIHIRLGVQISVGLTVAFEGKFTVKSVKERVEVTTGDGTTSHENEKTTFGASATVKGSLNVKLGVGLEIKFTLSKIFYCSVTTSGGAYLSLEGYGGIFFGDYVPEEDSIFKADDGSGKFLGGDAYYFNKNVAYVGKAHFDFGGYFGITIKAGLSIDLKLVEIDLSVKYSYEKKWSVYETGEEKPSHHYSLIFEDKLEGLYKDEVAANKPFKDRLPFGREFVELYGDNTNANITMNYDEYQTNLPRVFRRDIDLKTREVTYTPIPFTRLKYVFGKGTRIDSTGVIGVNDCFNPEINDLIAVIAVDEYGNQYNEDDAALIEVTKKPVPVEKVQLTAASEEIYSAGEACVYAKLTPEYASYKDMRYEVEQFIHNGKAVSVSDIEKYVRFDKDYNRLVGKLITSDLVSIGDTVTVRGTAIHDGITSNPLVLTVVRRPVEQVAFVPQNRQTTVVVGQELPFEVFAYPLNATFNKEGGVPTVTVNTPELAQVVKKDGKNVLKVVNDIGAFGQAIDLTISADDNGKTVDLNYKMMIIQVPIDTLKIKNRNFDELGERTRLNQGQSMSLIATAEPADATVLNKIQILKDVGNEYVTIDDSGVLHVSENAPIGYEFRISARYDNLNSKNYRFVVDKIATESVRLFEQNDNYETAPNGQLLLKTAVEPANATFFAPEFSIVSGAEWATIEYTGLLTVNENAPIGAAISVCVTVDGVKSNTVTFRIPAKKIEVTAPTANVNAGGKLVLGYKLYPTDNSILSVNFRFAEGAEYATINNGILSVNNDIGISDARIAVVAEIGDIVSKPFYVDIKVPVERVELYTHMTSNGNVELGSSILLGATVYPEYATNRNIEYSMDKPHLGRIENGLLTVASDESYIGEIIEIVATADGVVSNILRIRITKISVLAVEFENENLNCSVSVGGSMALRAYTLPANATDGAISYRISSGMDLASIDGNILKVSEKAPLGGVIQITASADGVDSIEYLTVTVVKVAVERVEISVDGDVNKISPMSKVKVTATAYPENATEKLITYSIVGEGRNYAYIDSVSGELTVNPAQLIVRGDIVVEVIAYADGIRSEALSLQIVVPVTDITMIGGDVTALCGDEIDLQAETNANATDKSVEFRFWDGEKICASSPYAIIDNDKLIINDNIFVPNAEICIVAVPKGADNADITSQIRKVAVHIPVKSVALMSNKTSIRLGEDATLSTSIFPAFASNGQTEYRFADNRGNFTDAPWGVSIDGNTVSVDNNLTVLTSTPRFIVCAIADGVVSNVWRFEVIERPVTKLTLSLEPAAAEKIRKSDKSGEYTVNPNVDYGFAIRAAVNGDASYKGITFSARRGETYISNVASAENRKFDGQYYYARLNVFKSAEVGEVITIIAQSQRNPQVREEISFKIAAIYADGIAGANISSLNKRGDKFATIFDGDEFLGNLNVYKGAYINPGDTISVNKLYFDDELSNNYFKNVTFDDRFTLEYSSTDFITVNENGFTVRDINSIIGKLKRGNDYFKMRILLDQQNGTVLSKEFTFHIYVGVKTVQYLGGYDATNKSFKMTDNGVLEVDRNAGSNGNEFTFRFSINNGSFTTNPLVLVNNAKLENNSILSGKENITVDSSGDDLLKGKTPPQVTFSVDKENEFCNIIKIKFEKWYNTGTEFVIELHNPDHGADRRPLYTFTLRVNPVNESDEFEFGRDGKFDEKTGIAYVDSGKDYQISYQVRYGEGPVEIQKQKVYADLRRGYAVKLTLGDQRKDLGQKWTLTNIISTDVLLYAHIGNKIEASNESVVGEFYISVSDKATDSYRANKLLKLVFEYVDGNQSFKVLIYIRIVDLIENEQISMIKDKNEDNHPRHNPHDLSEKVEFGYSTEKPRTYLKPDYKLLSEENAKILLGRILFVTNTTKVDKIADIRYDHIQYYNGNELQVRDKKIRGLERRFIANVEQFKRLHEFTNDSGEICLIKNLNMQDVTQYNLGDIKADFNGNGHKIYNVNFYMNNVVLKNDAYWGIFTKIMPNARVRNLILENVNMYSEKQHLGKSLYFGFLAHANHGTIENVQIRSGNINVERKGAFIGDLFAFNKTEGKIINCKNAATIRSCGNIGGIAAYNCGEVRNCSNFGNLVMVYKADKSIGGIVGYNFDNGKVLGCNQYSHISFEGLINGALKAGSIVGHYLSGEVEPGALGTHGGYDVGALGKGKVHMFGYGGYVGKKDV